MLNACDTGTQSDNVSKIKTAYVALATVQCAGHPAIVTKEFLKMFTMAYLFCNAVLFYFCG